MYKSIEGLINVYNMRISSKDDVANENGGLFQCVAKANRPPKGKKQSSLIPGSDD